jgi:hypothetical protein
MLLPSATPPLSLFPSPHESGVSQCRPEAIQSGLPSPLQQHTRESILPLISLSRAIARYQIWRLGGGRRADPATKLHEDICEISSTALMSSSNVGCRLEGAPPGSSAKVHGEFMDGVLQHLMYYTQTPTSHEGATQWTDSNTPYAFHRLHKLYRYHHQELAMEYVVLINTKLLEMGGIAVFNNSLPAFNQMKLKIMNF